MAQLKVFQTQIGFFDTVVAVTSQRAALLAWGTQQNLFVGGEAYLAKNEDAITAALEHPGIVLRRATGTEDMFAVEPLNLPEVPKQPKGRLASRSTNPTRMRQLSPARSNLHQAEAALAKLDLQWKRQEALLEGEQHALDERRETAWRKHGQRRKAAETTATEAREKYLKAVGLK